MKATCLIYIELRSPVATDDLIEFLQSKSGNHNLMIFGDTDAKRPVRSLVNSFGVEFENTVSREMQN